MSEIDNQYQTCEACGVSAEMGFVIKAGDDVATVTVMAENEAQAKVELDKYLQLATEVNSRFKAESAAYTDGKQETRIQFECSAEKLIFELRSRSIV
ncbi:DUF406 family protein [Thaumasiovibrio subtropicus]|uniref:DUF406 family protein n=1 Tax=Thaumasiovibrio subtropicus TaxID=1891207 RepID=UPI000B362A48|nr:DUF406 family protein [Thaumasiovibrio subtropicus]